MNQKDMERMGKTICESDFYKRFVRRDAWLSGCSTAVHPAMAWKRSIEIQLADRIAKGRRGEFPQSVQVAEAGVSAHNRPIQPWAGLPRRIYHIFQLTDSRKQFLQSVLRFAILLGVGAGKPPQYKQLKGWTKC